MLSFFANQQLCSLWSYFFKNSYDNELYSFHCRFVNGSVIIVIRLDNDLCATTFGLAFRSF
jgi:hypothetical protein